MTDYEHLEIISDEEDEDYSYSSNGEDDEEKCYYCDADLDYEDNEFYDWEAGRFYCERCWNQVIHDDD
jgi:hypothetical protein